MDSAVAAKFSPDSAIILATSGTGFFFMKLPISSRAFSGPASGTPTALSVQCSVDMIVGLRWPLCSLSQRDFVVMAPAPLSATSRQLDAVIPMMPEARTVGFSKVTPRMVWERFIENSIAKTSRMPTGVRRLDRSLFRKQRISPIPHGHKED